MPKKLNSAGQMQNYVPAGNGDASGEYGDNATGSNKHFTAFKKPSRLNELSKKQKKEIADYVYGRDLKADEDIARTIKSLRYYTGSFGDLSNFSDDDLKEIINEFSDLKESDTFVYIKDGQKWKLTKRTGLLDKLGIEYYTKEEYEEKIKNDNLKLVESSQTSQDKEIQKIMGNDCVVCFGKGYKDENLNQVIEDTKVFVNDFPELKQEIKMMGDRNNLEKFYNAIQQTKEPTEEEIQAKVEQLKRLYNFGGYSEQEKENKYRELAIKKLKEPIKLTSHNRAYAYWSPVQNAMVYMGKMKKIGIEEEERNYATNWLSSNKPNGTYCHEMGHAVDSAITNKYQSISKKIKDSFVENDFEYNAKIYEKNRELGLAYQDFRNTIKELSKQNYNKDFKEQYDKLMSEKLGMRYDAHGYNRNVYEADQQTKKELGERGIKKWALSEYSHTNIEEFVAESFSAYYTGMNNPLADKVVQAFKDFSNKLREFE